MSTNFELKARLAQLGPVRDMIPARSSSAETEPVLLRRTGAFRERITVFRRLFDEGVAARAAKDAIDRLASEDWTVCPVPSDTDFVRLARDLAALDVELSRRPAADDASSIAVVRERHGLSQREFAERLGVDLRTLQNWEQGRNRPDAAVMHLVRLFDRDPQLVVRTIYAPVA